MNKLDPNTLFSIFDQGDEQIYQDHGLDNLLSLPYIRLGMVVTGVDSYTTLDMLYRTRFKQQYDQVRERIKHKYFSKLYNYLTSVTLHQTITTCKEADKLEKEGAYRAFNDLLSYFESIEEYEKCTEIMKYITIITENTSVTSL